MIYWMLPVPILFFAANSNINGCEAGGELSLFRERLPHSVY
jgi:hypothetical protein